ncbi:MAG: prepilin-type N-terminal cleavage/methylation domain-containing protein [Chloroflexota bacterium]|nr:prepilin-type N-terminal cleavage/methylation domain-containing protein [Chloroflexota bacterium]
MKKLNRDQRGFTLVELLIAILLTGIVASAITGTILYVFNVNFSTANRMAAVRQVRNVGFWISPDVQMAQCVDTESEFLKLTWTDWAANYTHEVIYSLENMSSGEFKVLKREHKIDSALDSTTIVAEYIDPAETSCDWDCNCDCFWDQDCNWEDAQLTFEVTATVGGQSETREYEVQPRPGSQ